MGYKSLGAAIEDLDRHHHLVRVHERLPAEAAPPTTLEATRRAEARARHRQEAFSSALAEMRKRYRLVYALPSP